MKNRFPGWGFYIYILFAFIGIQSFSIFETTCSAQNLNTPASYDLLISQADQAYKSGDYPSALLFFEKARTIKPELKYAPGKIKDINILLDADPDLRSKLFEDILVQAETFYDQKIYIQAKTEYQKALLIDPSAQYPKDRLARISAVYADPDDLAFFNSAVSSGDHALAGQDFDKAILFYETALSVKPDSKSVKDKIANARKQQSEFSTKTAQASVLLAGGDKLEQADKLAEAQVEYQKALDILPNDPVAKQKMQELDKKIADKKALQDNYEKLIELADQFYINRDFANANIKYAEALKAKPNARYPKEMLEKTKSGEAQLQSDQERYDAAIASADNLFAGANYDAAIIGYKSASAIKPTETYPKTKVAEIEKISTDRASNKEAYDVAIKNADKAFDEKQYDAALAQYRGAASLLPMEKYPAEKINEINTLLSQQKSVDENYLKVLAEADKFFNQKLFDDAIKTYDKALELKPAETYPQQRITEARNQLGLAKNKEENYIAAITTGDRLFSEQKYDDALASYKQALNIKPAEKYPKDKSDEIIKINSKLKSDSQKYALAIANGDKAFAAGDLNRALIEFQAALALKPAETYPSEKIAGINTTIALKKQTDEKYAAAVNTGDKQFAAKEYETALLAYTEAGDLKKTEKYPQEQIVKINKILSDKLSAEENYTAAIAEGDKFIETKIYKDAIAAYTKAGAIKPAEAYPKAQLEKVNILIAGQKKQDADYLAAIASADKLFTTKKYTEAIADYSKALELKPGETYPTGKIAEAEKAQADLLALEESYSKAIADGDKYLADKDFTNSLAAFRSAVTLKPAEIYPKQKAAEIQAILDKDKAEGQRFQEAIDQADKLFTDKKYAEALEPYQRASGIKPVEKYPKEQITKINQLIAEQEKLDADYNKLLTDAAAKLKEEKYEESRSLYTGASALKPSEQLPKNKITEIDGILADIKLKEQNYADAIKAGDASFTEKKYSEAITSYTKALAVKPAETYPNAQIEKINGLIAEQKNLDDNYLAVVESADKLFESSKYPESVIEYRKALALKPSEKYPADRIAEAEKQIADQKAKQAAYDKAVADGDRKLLAKEYENALADFKTSASIKPEEKYPAQKITEIQSIIDKIKAENDSYAEAIAVADKFYASQKYREALEPYQRASTVKPTEKYPQDQIAQINRQLAEMQKLDDEYQNLLTQAENQLKTSKFEDARNLFTKAATLKPSETLPKEKIAEIDRILAELKTKDENYTKAINSASELYASKNLAGAVKMYEEALAIKPAEKLPQDRIAALKAELNAIDDSYTKAVASGDGKLAAKNLPEALNAYQNALEIKPNEEYPKTKIAEINTSLVAQKEEQEKMYNSYIAEGDQLLATKDYRGAKTAFTKAGGIKPGEAYPKQKLTEINKLVEEIELARRSEYAKAIGEADKLYNSKVFDLAIDAYEAAEKINPDDTYPQLQISKIRKYMSDHAIQDLYSQTALIKEGDEKKFTFSAIEPRLRKNNYVLLKARSTGKVPPKVFLSYGKDSQKNGSIVLRSIDKNTISDLIIRLSVQDKWYREDNNWISLYTETGEIEITRIQIAAGDE